MENFCTLTNQERVDLVYNPKANQSCTASFKKYLSHFYPQHSFTSSFRRSLVRKNN